MKIKIFIALVLLAHGALASINFTVTGGMISDGNPVGSAFNGVVSGLGSPISDVNVGLNLSGGYNGDLYAYLLAPNGTLVVLLNRPGTDVFGTPGAGYNVMLDDAAGTSIQAAVESAGVQFTGTYQAAGNLAGFNGGNPNGTWTLFFSDLSNGGGTSTLNGWSLDITAVPEPVNVALIIFAGLLLVVRRLHCSLKPKTKL